MFNVSKTTLLSHCVIINAAYRLIDTVASGTHVTHMLYEIQMIYNKCQISNSLTWVDITYRCSFVRNRSMK